MSSSSNGGRATKRMSLLDKMEHIAELAGLEDLIDSEDDDEEDVDVDSAVDTKLSGQGSHEILPLDEDEEDDDEEEEEDDDEIVYTATDLGYEWQGGAHEYDDEDLDYGALGYEDQSQFTGSDTNENSSLSSAGVMRRVSGIRQSTSAQSYSSAPEYSRDDALLLEEPISHQRRSTFAGPPGGSEAFKRRVSARRGNINLGSVSAPPGMNSLNMPGFLDTGFDDGSHSLGRGSVLQKMKVRTFGSQPRRLTGMKSRRTGRNTSHASTGSDLSSMQAAASRLESGPDSVFAAASVVAQSAATAAKRAGHVQFNVDDPVLCMLTLLNVTNPGDDNESFTVSPVNIHGYPPGEGKTEEERQGPYVFVLATVKKVHFDEDERYYFVVRADNGTEQRADTGGFCLRRNNITFRVDSLICVLCCMKKVGWNHYGIRPESKPLDEPRKGPEGQ
jgi:hypothetical protein